MNSSTEASDGTEIRVPRETVNDDVVIIAKWNVNHGARVRAGDSIVDIETSKAVLEIAADKVGYVQILHPNGSEVPVGEVIGHILPEPLAAPSTPTPGADSEAGASMESEPAVGYTLSRKAQRLVEEHEIELSVFEGRGLVRETDVIEYLEGRVAVESVGQAAAPKSAPRRSSGLLGDARISARERGRGLAWVVWNYFWRNWLLLHLVKVVPRGVIETLHRMRGVKIGQDCFVDPAAILETAHPEKVTLGNDVRVTSGAIIMTHIKAPHYLRETGIMPVVLKPVVLEDHCFIGVNAIIMPGVTVGKASVVASGAVVLADVPPYTMVAGNPAKVVKRFPKPESG